MVDVYFTLLLLLLPIFLLLLTSLHPGGEGGRADRFRLHLEGSSPGEMSCVTPYVTPSVPGRETLPSPRQRQDYQGPGVGGTQGIVCCCRYTPASTTPAVNRSYTPASTALG